MGLFFSVVLFVYSCCVRFVWVCYGFVLVFYWCWHVVVWYYMFVFGFVCVCVCDDFVMALHLVV